MGLVPTHGLGMGLVSAHQSKCSIFQVLSCHSEMIISEQFVQNRRGRGMGEDGRGREGKGGDERGMGEGIGGDGRGRVGMGG